MKVFQQNLSQMQNAGRKHRSTMDNLIIISTIIYRNHLANRATYAVFADAEKCFDRLWLKDSLLNLEELGVSKRDICMLYLPNKNAKVIVATPVGETAEILLSELVKQGTIFGPILCCASTDKVNAIDKEVVTEE